MRIDNQVELLSVSVELKSVLVVSLVRNIQLKQKSIVKEIKKKLKHIKKYIETILRIRKKQRHIKKPIMRKNEKKKRGYCDYEIIRINISNAY